MTQECKLRFISICIALQPLDALLDQLPESSADFEDVTRMRGPIFDSHHKLPGSSNEVRALK
jgi:hypothetical protein